ncbi:acyltransferase family protein [Blastococcus mobilis]|uniref:Peptidoglycan/LPS O-acetylase OafA/YrhL, contains acyltransferase and SGNH-hydrolase domains n=1 Tax=Blastococcus mobilis TaxID=1938746 RepID=A0A238XFC9_9ACTN|nr:acyltransferase [Blastococcus mobilis]SNR57716.1 Peptidoglycan/LPS O-acetylase OafA/YrhL, contains acyltransferase and SGNH-hydrolase domains [Blastococcus mobilis]
MIGRRGQWVAEPQRPSGGDIRGLTGLRAVAALWVVAHHFWLFSPESPWLRPLQPLWPLLEAGWLGVDLFFVLSGFVLTHNYVSVMGSRATARATAGFYRARLSRIWPTWMVVLTAATAGLVVKQLAVGMESTETRLDAVTMLRQVFLVQVWDRPDYAATGPVGPGWSLSAEWLAYVVFPALVLVLHRLRRLRPVVLGALALVAVTPFAYGCLAMGAHDWRWSWLLRLAGCFLAGALVALCVARVPLRPGATRAATRLTVVSSVLVLAVVWWADAIGRDHAGVAVLLFPVLVASLALTDGGLARPLSTPAMVLGGRISFALYLVHMGVFEAVWTLMDIAPSLQGGSVPAVTLQLALPLLPLPAAWALWRFVEEPARLRLRAPRPTAPATGPGSAVCAAAGAEAPVAVGR